MKDMDTQIHVRSGAQYATPRFTTDVPTVTPTASILELISITPVSGVTRFSFDETFGAEKPAVPISCLGDNLAHVMKGVVLQNVPVDKLTAHTLTRSAKDSEIRTELGVLPKTNLSPYIWELLAKQATGGDGPLLVKGWNVFVMKGWTIGASLTPGRGWNVGTGSGEWFAGCRIFHL